MKMKFKTWICPLIIMVMLLMLPSSCKKHDDNTAEEDAFKVIALPSLSDKIPYQALGKGKIVFDRINDIDGESGFYVIDIDKQKANGFRFNSGTRWPFISPDGTKIACSLLSSANWKSTWNIYIMNIDGSDCRPIFQSDNIWQTCPTWTPDGSKILFYEVIEGPLYMQSPVENATDRVELTKFLYEYEPDYMISPDGGFSISTEQKLVCTSRGNKTSGILGIVPYIGKAGVNLLLPLPYTDIRLETRFESPVFSPDELKIAFASIITDVLGNRTVSVKCINPNGSNLIELIKVKTYIADISWMGYGREVSLCWSPDGTKILFTALTEQNSGYHLFVINADGSGLTQVTDNINAYDFDISWGR